MLKVTGPWSQPAADCLFLVLVLPVNLGVDYSAMAADQHHDPELVALRSAATGLKLEETRLQSGASSLLYDVSTGLPRLVGHCWMFDLVHVLWHPGDLASVKLVSERFVHIRRSTRLLPVWLRFSSTPRHHWSPFLSDSRRFDRHVDLVGPELPRVSHTY